MNCVNCKVNPNWADFDASTATHAPEDIKAAEALFARKEDRRIRMNQVDEKVSSSSISSA